MYFLPKSTNALFRPFAQKARELYEFVIPQGVRLILCGHHHSTLFVFFRSISSQQFVYCVQLCSFCFIFFLHIVIFNEKFNIKIVNLNIYKSKRMWYNLYAQDAMGQYAPWAYLRCTVITVRRGISSLWYQHAQAVIACIFVF